jgi:hypothetical protein
VLDRLGWEVAPVEVVLGIVVALQDTHYSAVG